MKDLVSVVIAVYNGEKTLKETINSILSQTYHDLEVIVVDDGSTDKSREIVRGFDDKRISLILQKNSGSPAVPRNAGMRTAKGEYIAFCDQDDLWHPEKIELQLAAFQKAKPDILGFVYTSAELVDELGKYLGVNEVSQAGNIDATVARRRLLCGNNITACSVVVPKAVIDDVGLLREDLFGVDDYELWLRITEKYHIFAIEKPLCSWRVSKLSLSGNKLQQYLENEKIFSSLGEEYDVRVGHGKNIFRIIMAALLVEDKETLGKYLGATKRYPLSPKIKIFLLMLRFSTKVTRTFLRQLIKAGRVSL